MAFLVCILTIATLDASHAIYRRITIQNAADSAADAAALWQARGLNLLQHLNNWHYEVNEIAMGIAQASCCCVVMCDIWLACSPYNGFCAFMYWYCAQKLPLPAKYPCEGGLESGGKPRIEHLQENISELILEAQEIVTKSFPVFALIKASDMAKASGADSIIGGVAFDEYLVDFEKTFKEIYPQTFDIYPHRISHSGVVQGVSKGIARSSGADPGNYNNAIPDQLFAAPLDASSLSLGVRVKRPPPSHSPWNVPRELTCGLVQWEDTYYYGHPQYTTWMVVKKSASELLGLGDLTWLNPRSNADHSINDQVMYKGPVRREGSSKLRIPAYSALASSQAEGEVIDHGHPHASGKIIPVRLPIQDVWGSDYGIYH